LIRVSSVIFFGVDVFKTNKPGNTLSRKSIFLNIINGKPVRFTDEELKPFLKELLLNLSFIIGQLQHAGIIELHQWNHFKVPVDLFN